MKPFSFAARVGVAASALAVACLAWNCMPRAQAQTGTSSMSPAAKARFASQLKALEAFRNSLSPSQLKLPPTLLLGKSGAARTRSALPRLAGNRSLQSLQQRQSVLIYGQMTPRIKAAIEREGELTGFFPESGVASANLSTTAMEHIAAATEINSIVLNRGPRTKRHMAGPRGGRSSATPRGATGAIVSEGDKTHQAEQARTDFKVSGAGIKIGVISDSAESLKKLQTAGELPADVKILTGQAGKGISEGTAMMEIIHDLAPDAKLEFSTSGNSPQQMAKNILALQKDGCQIIVDDIGFDSESVFQEDVVSAAIRQVSALGVVYLTAIGNDGNQKFGPTGSWDGFFVDGGTEAALGTEILNDWNSKGDGFDKVTSVETFDGLTDAVLAWADPNGKSGNDYNLYNVDPKGNLVSAGVVKQTGNGQPMEFVGGVEEGNSLVVTRAANSKLLPIRLYAFGATFEHSVGPTGFGHGVAEFALSVGASPAAAAPADASPLVKNGPFPGPFTDQATMEDFSSTGPRTLYFTPDGAPQTRLIKKPDITAADGVKCATEKFEIFYGTSAAAPHAAAIAALAWSQDLAQSGDKIKTRMLGGVIDIGAKGFEDDSGNGIVMAPLVLKTTGPTPTPGPTATPVPTETPKPTPGPSPTPTAPPAGSIAFTEGTYSVKENAGTMKISVRRVVVNGQGDFGPVSVKFQTTTGGTATLNADYRAASGTLTWADGESGIKTFLVPVVDDFLREPTETVALRLYDLRGRGTLASSRKTATLSILDNETGTVDTTSPRVAIKSPANGSRVSNVNVISGTVSDEGGTKVSSVVLFIRRPSDGAYWNGTEWVSRQTALSTTLTSNGWVRAAGNPPQSQLNDDFLLITAVATDGAGNVGQTSARVFVDASPPQVFIFSPSKGAKLRALTRANGTVSDASGDAKLVLFLQRASDGKYWTGTGDTWNAKPTPLAVELASSGEWSRSQWPVLTAGSYSLTATATDEVGNSASARNEFLIVGSTGSGGRS